MAYCKKCGKELKSGAMFCTNCGAKTDVQNIPSKKNNKVKKYALAGGVVIVLIAVVIVIKSHKGGQEEKKITANEKSQEIITEEVVEKTKSKEKKVSQKEIEAISDYEYEIRKEKVCITDYKGHDFELTIPSYIEGYPVTKIGDGAFMEETLDKVILPDTIEEIGDSAFEECAINEIYLPEGLQYIDENAFKKTTKLKEITIPSTVTRIGSSCFWESQDLEKVIFLSGNALAAIEESAFKECKKISGEIDIPGNYLVIGDKAFYESGDFTFKWEKATVEGEIVFGNEVFRQSGVKEATIDMDISKIPSQAFFECDKLTTVSFPDSVSEIRGGAFDGCDNLEKIDLNEGLVTIGANAFKDCVTIKKIVIPSTVENVGEYSFWGCKSLDSIEFKEGKNPASIGGAAFHGCGDVKEILIPKNYVSVKSDFVFDNLSLFRWETGGEDFPNQTISSSVAIASRCDIEIYFPKGMVIEADNQFALDSFVQSLASGSDSRSIKVYVDEDSSIAHGAVNGWYTHEEIFEYYD